MTSATTSAARCCAVCATGSSSAARTSLDEYLDFLGRDAQEPELLAKDLLIGVTSFFRDPAAFEYLGLQVLPQIFAAAREHDSVRIWVPGCASGEEAYSIGILVRERLAQLGLSLRVQIFGTDIDSEAIAEARHGRYPSDVVEHVSPERLARFFIAGRLLRPGRQGGAGDVHLLGAQPDPRRAVRERRPHLLSQRADLSGRGAAEEAGAVVPLCLAGAVASSSSALRKAWRATPSSSTPSTSGFAIFKRRESETAFVDLPLVGRLVPRATPAARHAPPASQTRKQAVNAAFERLMLQEYTPPSVVTNERGDVICVAGQTGRYLQPPVGILTSNVLDIAHAGLRIELRTALHAAVRSGTKVVRDNVHVEVDGAPRRLRITVRPLYGVKEEQLFVIILDGRADGGASSQPAISVSPVISLISMVLGRTAWSASRRSSSSRASCA